jgi:hypothetical protein
MSRPVRASRNTVEVDCLPRSEWKIAPPASRLCAAAMVIASTTSSARMCSAIARGEDLLASGFAFGQPVSQSRGIDRTGQGKVYSVKRLCRRVSRP